MKAIVWTKYGAPEGLQLREVPTPTPKDQEVLIRVHAATVSTPDIEFRRLKLPILYALPLRLYLGVLRPNRITILGTEFSGEIVEVGREVTRYKPGDLVFGYTGLGMGTYAEFLCLAEKPTGMASLMAPKPVNATYEEAAALSFGALEALHALRKANIQKGQKVLIVGAGGNIGSYAVQLAKHYGAEVTGVDKAGKLEMLRSIGADQVIDYAKEDFTQCGQMFDVIFDTIGKSPFTKSLRLLNGNGAYLNANPGLLGGMRMRWAAKSSSKRIMPWSAAYTTQNLLAVKELFEAGVIRAVIDRRYPMEQIVEAHRYVESGQKKGNVVMTLIS
jgi:NADPH:quinone reductase-like Zn-dependent oxidoreductase